MEILESGFKVKRVLYNPGLTDYSFLDLAKEKVSELEALNAGKTYNLGGKVRLKCIYVNGKTRKETFGGEITGGDRDAIFVLDYNKFRYYSGANVNAYVGANSISSVIRGEVGNVDVMCLNRNSSAGNFSAEDVKELKPEYTIALLNGDVWVPFYTFELKLANDNGIVFIQSKKSFNKYQDEQYESGLVLDGESIVITVPKKKTFSIDGFQAMRDEKIKKNNDAPEVHLEVELRGKEIKLDPAGTSDQHGIQRVYYIVSDTGKTISADNLKPQFYTLDVDRSRKERKIRVKMFAFDKYGKYGWIEKIIEYNP